jgi:cyanamide hydratase
MSEYTAHKRAEAVAAHNFEAVPRDLKKLVESADSGKKAVPHREVYSLPSSTIAKDVLSYAEEELPKPTLQHSLRVFQFGMAIAEDFFPEWKLNSETWLAACLLHDIGTTPKNQSSTLLSFEFQGGMIAYSKTQSYGSSQEQSEAVAEAIIRHQDIDEASKGSITRLGALLQLATLYDNAGQFAELVDETTLDAVVQACPRLKWSGCFSAAVAHECDTKPYSHTTKIGKDDFIGMIKGNKVGNAKE